MNIRSSITCRRFSAASALLLAFSVGSPFPVATARADFLPIVQGVDWQPFAASIKRIVEASDFLGAPIGSADIVNLNAAMALPDHEAALARVQQILDPYCLVGVDINAEMRVKVAPGAARPELEEKGWTQFLVKVHNESGTTGGLVGISPNAISLFQSASAKTSSDLAFRKKNGTLQGAPADPANLWLDLRMYDAQPLMPKLSGLLLEYRIIQLYSRDAGKREGKFAFNVGQGTQDIGFRNETVILFNCRPAHEVLLMVKDENDNPTTAGFLIKDKGGRVYPSQAKRLAPDFAFQPQIYRADGEKIRLPEGTYTIQFNRGPESITETRTVTIDKHTRQLDFKVERWIDPSKLGWWSGDHHIHAAGCAHYTKPSEGVLPDDMMRHILGEDVKVGCNLTWGPCFDYQKQFFCGLADKLVQGPYHLHYDIEVSQFGSHMSGHLCLLRLQEEIYPGGDSKNHWPTECLNTLRWAKLQGAIVGPAHSGWGLEVPGTDLPNYNMPKFDGIGANEYIVDVTHEIPGPNGRMLPAVDFMSMVDTPYVWELNIWYHTLNAGFRTRISGETDFPCIYGERVGLGRSYVKLDSQKIDYGQWCENIRQGRNYVSDGRSHLINFTAAHSALQNQGNAISLENTAVAMGENGSELHLTGPQTVKLSAKVAARLNEKADPDLRDRPYEQKPYWDIERARLGDSREVPLEVVVNGVAVARKNIPADGKLRDYTFDVKIDQSSWVALRILPSSHTNPIFVIVDNKPIRSSKRSIDWCLRAVDQCWSQKERFHKGAELAQAKQDYDHARQVYQQRLTEATAE